MSNQIAVLKRVLLRLGPFGVVITYLLTLFAVVAGAVAFPSSIVSTILLFTVIGAFFAVTVPVIVRTYLVLMIVICRRLMAFPPRLHFGSDPNDESQGLDKPSLMKKGPGSEQKDNGLWDRWIDEVW
jgi:hypothetical protein